MPISFAILMRLECEIESMYIQLVPVSITTLIKLELVGLARITLLKDDYLRDNIHSS
jgi:hypothetical protein